MLSKEQKTVWQREYRKKNTEKVRKIEKKYKDANPEVVKLRNREWRLQKYFNITDADFQTIRKFQAEHPRFRLLIGKGARIESVEHRHSDGLIRGVMSGLLNKAYGSIERMYPKNTGDVLRALAEFHDNPPASTALGEIVYGVLGKARAKQVLKYGPDGRSNPIPRAKRAVEV